MITSDYARQMARYSNWQNESLTTAADGLDDAARQQDRGAFFGSIAGTLNHLLWGDRIWLDRFAGTGAPNFGSISLSVEEEPDWPAYKTARAACDAEISRWAASLSERDLQGDITWFSGSIGQEITKPTNLLIVHFFNHGIHHRGQVHAMLTAAGAKPDATDLPFMPEG